MVDPLQALTGAQREALGLVQETFDGIIDLSRTGITQPEETVRRLTALVGAVGDLEKLATPVLAVSEMIRSEPVKPRERKP